MISIDDFKKVEIKIGKIVEAEKVPETDKLLKLTVDFGEESKRTIVSGIALYIEPTTLIGKRVAFATNLEPRQIKGFESQGMILAVSGEGYFSLLEANENVPPGAAVK